MPTERVFKYICAILSTRRQNDGIPVVFGLAKVGMATSHFTDYLNYLLTGAEVPRTGELKRAVREAFTGISNANIGDGTVPSLEGGVLSADQVAELAYHLIPLDEKIPRTSRHDWRSEILTWKSLFIKYNAVHGDLWEGFMRSSLAEQGEPVIIYRLFLLASGITHNTSCDPSQLQDAVLPKATPSDYQRFKDAIVRNADSLDANIRTKIWNGFQAERNPHYLAAGVRKPSRKPLSSTSMLEMFDCYFNHRDYKYDRTEYSLVAIKALKVAKTIGIRYWPMLGTIAIGLSMCFTSWLGMVALVLLLVTWSTKRHSEGSTLETVSHWRPLYSFVYILLCSFVGNSPLLAIITSVPVAVFAAHLSRNWDSLLTAA